MNRPPALFLSGLASLMFAAISPAQSWHSTRLHEVFHAEGASAGDIDGDGQIDLVEGPLWYRGPGFEKAHELAPAKSFPKESYSDQFFSQVVDVTGDNAADVIVVGFPGKPARLYVNPGTDSLDRHWDVAEITGAVDNESPAIVDIIPGGVPEIVCGHETRYGYFQAGEDPAQAWSWHPISRPGACPNKFVHGMGVGDVNGDGRLDILDRAHWWEHPADETSKALWKQHTWAPEAYGRGGAQICVGDVDGDQDSDIVTSLNAHGYGLAWFEQTSPGTFERHDIMGGASTDNPHGVAFSQLHAVALRDLDGDGSLDIITGRRHWAHGGKDPGGLQDPVLYWFRNTKREGTVEFVPHRIHEDSGVGVDILVTDLNNDQRLDIVSASKRGLTVHLQLDAVAGGPVPRWQETAGRDQSKYAEGFSPQAAAENMLVPKGFSVDLIASEPDLTQPIAMCFDARGRIWVIEGHTYPVKAPPGKGRDRILVFEDADSDGTFETRKVFAEGLNLASGIEVGFGGVFIGAAPELLFLPDSDRDDRADSEPVVLLDGWGYHDTHETLNSFTWGPDGWLYGCQGVFTHSKVGKPGTPDHQRVPINAGVWRYHPSEQRFEVFAHGTSNPWGVDFNETGDWFISACVIPHLYHVVPGGRYQRQAGRHFNPHTYDDIKTIADHDHYTGSIREHAFWGENKTTRPAAAIATSVLGGGHAHCGLAIYNGNVFPDEYRGGLLFHNLHGHRLVRESVQRDGSGYVGRHRPDFALARDHHQIGVGVMVGPDGAIYTSDWHDPQTCHNRDVEIWDRSNGRIFRIRYGDPRPYRFDGHQESDSELVQRLRSDNGFFWRMARRILQERSADGSLGFDDVTEQLTDWLNQATTTRDRLRALWTLHSIGRAETGLLVRLLAHEDPHVRGWSVQLIGDPAQPLSPDVRSALVDLAAVESNLVVQRNLASLLQRIPAEQRMEIARGLIGQRLASHDRNLPWLIWYGIEPLVESHGDTLLEMVETSGLGGVHRFVIRRIAGSPEGRTRLVDRLADPKHRSHFLVILEELDQALAERGGAEMPAGWPSAFATLRQAPMDRVKGLARSVAVHFGDNAVLPHFRSILADPTRPKQQRIAALKSLRSAEDPALAEQLISLLNSEPLADVAASALAEYDDPAIPEHLIAKFDALPDAARTSALGTLASRRASAEALLDAMESGRIAAEKVPAFIVRQVLALEDAELAERLESVWGRITVSSAEMQDEYAKYRAMLRPRDIAAANASRGRGLYQANCGNCHKLFGVGGDIGPDITGANRTKVDYWLENILEPNALIGRAYKTTTLLTGDGRVISGIAVAENEDAITIQTATEKLVVPLDQVEARRASEVSLMPAGQLETMTPQQIRDLFKYFTGPGQVPLPKQSEESS